MIAFTQPVLDLFDETDLVHGIMSLDPPSVRCDGCGHTATGPDLAVLVLTCGILFNAREYGHGERRRLCAGCRAEAGWTR